MSLRYAILGLLDYCPMSGYNLKKVFDKSINYVWNASISQIYRELATLEKEGYVSSKVVVQDDRPDKKVYEITEEGRVGFLEWLGQRPGAFISPKRDEFMLKLLFGASLGKEGVKDLLEQFIQERLNAKKAFRTDRESLMKLAGDYGEVFIRRMEKEGRYIRIVMKRAFLVNQLLIDWARECIDELDKEED